ncbi:MAG: hypothetical protein HC802_22800 [Caldilineaceae bacterium]|nr:hypothetical protein [Caldilineaceae bacterium]
MKIRSQLVEFTAVEDALRGVQGVRNAAVVARPGPSGDLRLVAYIEPDGEQPSLTVLSGQLKRRFPVVPAQYIFLESLPTTATDKVNRRLLPEPAGHRPQLDVAYLAPRTPLESMVARIWADVLGIDPVGIHDNFLDLGGDSLLASQVITRVMDSTSTALPIATLYAAPTIAEMALSITRQKLQMLPASDIEKILANIEPGNKP